MAPTAASAGNTVEPELLGNVASQALVTDNSANESESMNPTARKNVFSSLSRTRRSPSILAFGGKPVAA